MRVAEASCTRKVGAHGDADCLLEWATDDVTETEDQVVQAVRRDHPNPVRLEGADGIVVFVNWNHITSIAPQPEPPLVS
jgi:hypothetical protein